MTSPSDAPVVRLDVYRNDCVVVRRGQPNDMSIDDERGQVAEFSKRSRMRLAFLVNNTPVEFDSLLTLTYPGRFPQCGLVVKKHLHAILAELRRQYTGLEYVWFLEFQQRGAPHFHILLNVRLGLHKRERLPQRERVNAAWYRIVGSNEPKHRQAGINWENVRLPDGLRHYAVKYMAKMEQKTVPPAYRNVGRLWGSSWGVRAKPIATVPANTMDVLIYLTGWRYQQNVVDSLPKVLYNASNDVCENLQIVRCETE